MKIALFVQFADASQAERALAALTDRGGEAKDMTAMFPNGYQTLHHGRTAVEEAVDGVSVTTGADAAKGAERGAVVGLGLGALAALASLVIPGFGLVTGGGALASALIGWAGSTAAGALAGGVAGYLQDQGVPSRIALDAEAAVKNGSAVVSIEVPTGSLGEFEVMEIVSKYHAVSFGRQEYLPDPTVAPVFNQAQ